MLYAISDLHGRFDKYETMLQKIGFSDSDTLYVLGDVIDRGPDGLAILQDMMLRPNVLPLLGNHEFTAAFCIPWLTRTITEESLARLTDTQLAAFNDWLSNGGEPTLRALRALSGEERQEILDYLMEMELYAEVTAGGRAFLLCHSLPEQYAPGRPLEDYDIEEFLFGRPGRDAPQDPDRLIVFGHTPTPLLGGQSGIWRKGNLFDIDCGCSFRGGQLGCLCLDTLEEFYV